MPTANELYFDAVLRHQISLRRYSNSVLKDIMVILDKADTELAAKLRSDLPQFINKPLDLKSKRLKALLEEIRAARQAAQNEISSKTTEQLKDFVTTEPKFETNIIAASLGFELQLAAVQASTLNSIVTAKPFSGGANSARTLEQWWDSVAAADQGRILEAIQLGLTQGETIDEMTKRIIGTRSAQYADGLIAITRRNAEAVVRTAVNHISNAAREEVWIANEPFIYALRWTSTLDGRTSAICRTRDGQLVPMGNAILPKGSRILQPPGARPPAHPNCRSLMVALFSAEGITDALGDRPYVIDDRTRSRREKDFRAEARDKDPTAWKGMTVNERNAEIRKLKQVWVKERVGTTSGTTDYGSWLKRQTPQFQDKVLGKAKGAAFRSGKIKIEEFTDLSGQELTLKELRATHPEAFN